MLRKDYIMRQFEEFGKVMAVILGFKKQNDWEKFEKEINDAAKKFTSFDINYVENLSVADFEKEIMGNAELFPDQQKILADLLYEKMWYYGENKEEEKFLDIKTKCTFLYQNFYDNLTQNEFNLDVHYKLGVLNKLNNEI